MAKKKETNKYMQPITLYKNDEPVVFNGSTDWVEKTGYSGAIIRDMLDGYVQQYRDYEYRG